MKRNSKSPFNQGFLTFSKVKKDLTRKDYIRIRPAIILKLNQQYYYIVIYTYTQVKGPIKK